MSISNKNRSVQARESSSSNDREFETRRDDDLNGDDGNDDLSGDDRNDRSHGGRGDDRISGRNGNDDLNGDDGNDDLSGDDGNDKLGGGLGDDSLSGGNKNDRLSGDDGNDDLSGDDGNDNLRGGNGDDDLDGGFGKDVMTGGAGDDSYVVDARGDRIIESANGGEDTVTSSISYKLANHVENLILTGAAEEAKGNKLDNQLTGNDLDNELEGEAGNDTLIGGAGNDTLKGGKGSDELTGGTGNDTFKIKFEKSSFASTDTITDFVSGQDTIELDLSSRLEKLVKAQLDTEGLNGAYLRYEDGNLLLDADGAGAGQAITLVTLTGLTSPELKANDIDFD